MQNIEFKAELRDLAIARAQCIAIGAKRIGTIEQTDTYFRMPDGRLKKREAQSEPIEWIFYHRPDKLRPKMCNFTILSDRQAKTRWGTGSLRSWLTVKKKRELWIMENTRIHLDVVEELGTFIEFEALVSAKYNVQECHTILSHLREEFGPVMGEAISVSYCDLMEQETAQAGRDRSAE